MIDLIRTNQINVKYYLASILFNSYQINSNITQIILKNLT